MDYEKKYKEAIERARISRLQLLDIGEEATEIEHIFPELKGEDSEDYRIKKNTINIVREAMNGGTIPLPLSIYEESIAWLEKQDTNKSISTEEMNKSIGRNIATSLIKYLDENRYEGAMNMSSIECEDLEKSILDSDWGKVYRYMQKKLEKQGEQKSSWSEEDDMMIDKIIDEVTPLGECPDYPTEKQRKFYEECNEKIEWLKSLKQKFHWKPSEEEINAFEHFVRSIGESGYASPYDNNTKLIYSLLDDLKKLL